MVWIEILKKNSKIDKIIIIVNTIKWTVYMAQVICHNTIVKEIHTTS